MRHLILTATLLTTGLLAHGQTDDFDIKETQKTLAKINDSLYASKYEVSNKQYLAFLNFLKQSKETGKYATAQIDTAKWKDKLTYNEPYVTYYHAHPAYKDYPVVNITYEGATLFCEWLTDRYNSSKKRKFNKVRFRLPTGQEWTTAAKGGNPSAIYPWEGTDLQNNKEQYRCNFRHSQQGGNMGVAGKLNDNADITAPSATYWPNGFGLYNMSGNVAEMLSDKGQTKGGSWLDTEESMKINAEHAGFDSATPTIGFRYFVDIIEN